MLGHRRGLQAGCVARRGYRELGGSSAVLGRDLGRGQDLGDEPPMVVVRVQQQALDSARRGLDDAGR